MKANCLLKKLLILIVFLSAVLFSNCGLIDDSEKFNVYLKLKLVENSQYRQDDQKKYQLLEKIVFILKKRIKNEIWVDEYQIKHNGNEIEVSLERVREPKDAIALLFRGGEFDIKALTSFDQVIPLLSEINEYALSNTEILSSPFFSADDSLEPIVLYSDPGYLFVAENNIDTYKQVMNHAGIRKIMSEKGGNKQLHLSKRKIQSSSSPAEFTYFHELFSVSNKKRLPFNITDSYFKVGEQDYYEVGVKFDETSSKEFEIFTAQHLNQRVACIIDDFVYSAPTVNEKITGGFIRITGIASKEEARILASLLRTEALPAKLTVEEEAVFKSPVN